MTDSSDCDVEDDFVRTLQVTPQPRGGVLVLLHFIFSFAMPCFVVDFDDEPSGYGVMAGRGTRQMCVAALRAVRSLIDLGRRCPVALRELWMMRREADGRHLKVVPSASGEPSFGADC